MSMNELTAKIRELRELQALIDEAQQEAEEIKYAIKAHMGDADELRAGEYKVEACYIVQNRHHGAA